jgi:hypothetical protein
MSVEVGALIGHARQVSPMYDPAIVHELDGIDDLSGVDPSRDDIQGAILNGAGREHSLSSARRCTSTHLFDLG